MSNNEGYIVVIPGKDVKDIAGNRKYNCQNGLFIYIHLIIKLRLFNLTKLKVWVAKI